MTASGHSAISFPPIGPAVPRPCDLPVREVPTDDVFQLREDAMTAALEGAAVCFLARPNNPTGALWDRNTVSRLIEGHPSTVFVVDEAYIDYCPGASMWTAVRLFARFQPLNSRMGQRHLWGYLP